MDVRNPAIVQRYVARAKGYFRAATDLRLLGDRYDDAIGLLCVHACIALTDAVLTAAEGERSTAEDHRKAGSTLRAWCSANKLEASGLKHFDWLIGQKNRFAYEERDVPIHEYQRAAVKMDQYFAWIFRTFPDVAQLPEADNE